MGPAGQMSRRCLSCSSVSFGEVAPLLALIEEIDGYGKEATHLNAGILTTTVDGLESG